MATMMMMMPIISNHHQTCSCWLLWLSAPIQAVRPAHRASFKHFFAILAGLSPKYKQTRQWRSFLEATADHFDWLFHTSLDGNAVPSLYEAFWLAVWAKLSICGHFCVAVDFGNKIKKVRNIRGLKMVIFYSKYEPQINWANACDTNLDISSSGLARNGSIYFLSTIQSLLSRNGWKFDTALCMTVKIKPNHTISSELNEYMPCCIPSLSSLLSLILLL